MKRIADIVLSVAGLAFFLIPFGLIAILIYIDNPGKIIFAQERIGLNGEIFYMYKFRTMRSNTPAYLATAQLKDPDRYLTRLGRILRKCSIDELPQFVNVIRGDMSLIGPRPEVPFHVSHFKEEVPLYLLRQQVRPGITGWAQVNGLRGDTSIEERVKYDLWYIENWTIWLDMKILLMTVFGGMVNKESIKL